MKVDKGVMMPRRATKGSAGYDFFAPKDITLKPGVWTEINTGVQLTGDEKVSVPSPGRNGKVVYPRWCMLLVPKSGLGTKYRTRIANNPGTIDQDYVGKYIMATMTSDVEITIPKDNKFIQGLVIPCAEFEDEIKPEDTRKGGFGSTGE